MRKNSGRAGVLGGIIGLGVDWSWGVLESPEERGREAEGGEDAREDDCCVGRWDECGKMFLLAAILMKAGREREGERVMVWFWLG